MSCRILTVGTCACNTHYRNRLAGQSIRLPDLTLIIDEKVIPAGKHPDLGVIEFGHQIFVDLNHDDNTTQIKLYDVPLENRCCCYYLGCKNSTTLLTIPQLMAAIKEMIIALSQGTAQYKHPFDLWLSHLRLVT